MHWNSAKIQNGYPKQFTAKSLKENHAEELMDEVIVASCDTSIYLPADNGIKDSIRSLNCGDSMWTNNGSVSLVKIIEVSDWEIKYKRCANLNGPAIAVYKKDIAKIKFSDGSVQSYEKEREKWAQRPKKEELIQAGRPPSKYYSQRALISALISYAVLGLVVLCYFSGIILIAYLFNLLAIAGLVFAWIYTITSFRKLKKNPDHYSGKGMTYVALTLCLPYSLALLAIAILGIIVTLLAFFG